MRVGLRGTRTHNLRRDGSTSFTVSAASCQACTARIRAGDLRASWEGSVTASWRPEPTHYERVQSMMVAGGWCRLRLGNCRPSGAVDTRWMDGVRWGRASPRPLRPEARSVSRRGRELSLNRVREGVPGCTGRRPRSHSVGHSAVWSSVARLPDDRRRDGRHLGVRMTIVCCCDLIRRRCDAQLCGHL